MGVEQVEKPALARHQFAEHGVVLVAAVANGDDRAILPEGLPQLSGISHEPDLS
jgi:hypothetical protein